MTEQTKQAMLAKNTRIIEAIKARAERVCPGALDLIAVTGSFASGDYHEKSDLDLLIVISDDRGYALSHCFITDDIGYDLYCHTWERLETAADYQSPYVSKLLDAEIVYCRDSDVRSRFSAIAQRLETHLASPLTEDDLIAAMAEVKLAKEAYFDLAACEGNGFKKHLLAIYYHLECAVYLCNHALVRHGVAGICRELSEISDLPTDFLTLHASLLTEPDYALVLSGARLMTRNTAQWVESRKASVSCRAKPNADNLRGTLEELWSNYRGKLFRAEKTGDDYLAQMTLASAGLFFAEVAEAVDIAVPPPFSDAAYRDPCAAKAAFEEALGQYADNYRAVGLPVCRYADISAFENAYIHGDAE